MTLLHALEATADGTKEVLAVFTTIDAAMAFADGEELESAEDELAAGDVSPGEVKLDWRTGDHETGDEVLYTEFDQSYSGATYVILPVRLDPKPVA